MARDRDDEPDDADDDRPRRRRRRDDDDRDAPPKKSSSALLILLVVGCVFGLFALVCAGVAVALILPATAKVREAAGRMQGQNNLKQMSLAAHNFADVNGNGLVGPYHVDKKGVVNQGLSFRVALLPYVEQANLYSQFDVTQPWDGVKNSALSSMRVMTFQDPAAPAKTETPYRVFYGGGALFDATGVPVPFSKVPDGTSNTILFVHAADSVTWTKPEEFAYSRSTPLPKLGSPGTPGGFNAAMADGSVRFIRSTIPEADLRSLIEKADGRVVVLE